MKDLENEIAQKLHDITGINSNGLKLLSQSANVVYGNDHVVVRVSTNSLSRELAEQGFKNRKEIVKFGAPYAPVLYDDIIIIDGNFYSLWVKGEALDKEDPLSYFYLGNVLNELHSIDSIGSYPVINYAPRIERRLNKIEELGKLSKGEIKNLRRIGDILLQRIDSLPSEHVVLHGDAHVGNIIIVEEEPYLIDPEGISTGHIVVDLIPTISLHKYNKINDDCVQNFIRGYDMSDELIEKVYSLASFRYYNNALFLGSESLTNRDDEFYHDVNVVLEDNYLL